MAFSSDVMIDLETWGTGPRAAIISIGAVEFARGGLGREFYTRVNPLSCEILGLEFDEDTRAWWAKQSDAARKVFGGIDAEPAIDAALKAFTAWFPDKANLWGNGSDFDNVILASAYQAAGYECPWKFYRNRCYRTLKSLRPEIKLERMGTHHNALDDAKTQAKHAVQILRGMRAW